MYIPTVKHKDCYTDIYSAMMENRNIFITYDISKESAATIVAQLMYLDHQSHDDISLYISSNGGDVDGLFMILDTMKIISSDVVTINIGAAYSCAAILLLCGAPGKRYAFENSRVMIHQPLAGMNGYIQTSDLEIKTRELVKTKKKLCDLVTQKTHLSVKETAMIMERDTYYTAEQAKEAGIVDNIL